MFNAIEDNERALVDVFDRELLIPERPEECCKGQRSSRNRYRNDDNRCWEQSQGRPPASETVGLEICETNRVCKNDYCEQFVG